MKIFGCILIFVVCSLSGFAQFPDLVKSKKNQLTPNYVGLRLNKTFYYLHFNQEPFNGFFVALPILHIGYYLTKSSALQIGLAYGRRKFKWTNTYNDEEENLIQEYNFSKSKGLILPITWRYTFNPAKRFQFIGSASVVSAYGSISEIRTGKINQIPSFTYQATTEGFNAFITGTLGVNYQINQCWEVNAEFVLFNRNVKELSGLNISQARTGPRILKVIGLGINYKL